MVAAAYLSTPSTSKLLRETRIGHCHAVGEGRWKRSSSSHSNRQCRDGIRGPPAGGAILTPSMGFGFLSNGFGGYHLIHWESDRVMSSSSRVWLGESWVFSHRGPRANCLTEMGTVRRFPKGLRIARADRPVEEVLRRKRQRGAVVGGFSGRHRRWRVRATDDAEQDPLGEGYWDGAEGKQQLNDIEDMKELIAEAENLRRAESAERGPGELTSEEIEKQKTEKLREELARRAREQAEQRKQAEIMFGMGQRAYGRGVYDKSVELLEAALSNVPGASNLGGEIQIWLAMAYEAHNRHGDCIALYKRIEATHPNKQIRRQAADLRYILDAPKLKISKEEMVSIPIIERDYDRGSKTWSQKVRDRRRKPIPKSKDYLEDWLVWDPPRWERNPYFWVAFTVWLTLVGISLMFQD